MPAIKEKYCSALFTCKQCRAQAAALTSVKTSVKMAVMILEMNLEVIASSMSVCGEGRERKRCERERCERERCEREPRARSTVEYLIALGRMRKLEYFSDGSSCVLDQYMYYELNTLQLLDSRLMSILVL